LPELESGSSWRTGRRKVTTPTGGAGLQRGGALASGPELAVAGERGGTGR
jgi:hypothetical protein